MNLLEIAEEHKMLTNAKWAEHFKTEAGSFSVIVPGFDCALDSLTSFWLSFWNLHLNEIRPVYKNSFSWDLRLNKKNLTGSNSSHFYGNQTIPAPLLFQLNKIILSIIPLLILIKHNRFKEPVKMHELNSKTNFVHKILLSKNSNFAKIEYFNSPVKSVLSSFLRQRTIYVQKIKNAVDKGRFLKTAESADFREGKIPITFPKSKTGYLKLTTEVDPIAQLFKSPIKNVNANLKKLKITSIDDEFKELLIALSNRKVSSKGDFEITVDYYRPSLRNFYIEKLVENGFGDIFLALEEMKKDTLFLHDSKTRIKELQALGSRFKLLKTWQNEDNYVEKFDDLFSRTLGQDFDNLIQKLSSIPEVTESDLKYFSNSIHAFEAFYRLERIVNRLSLEVFNPANWKRLQISSSENLYLNTLPLLNSVDPTALHKLSKQ